MYPFIRSGDVLTVQPAEAADLNVGDVAFYRAPGDRLVAHRVVGKCAQDKHVETWHAVSLRVRGDAASGPGEQIRAREVLGQVVSIQRGRKSIRVDRGFRRLAANEQVCKSAHLLICSLAHLKRVASLLLCCLQRLRFYRSLARKLIRKQVCYRVAGAEDAYDCSRLYGYNRFPELQNVVEPFADQLRGLEGRGYAVIASARGRIAGAVFIRQFPESTAFYQDWWLFGLLVRTRYRGAGIGEGLVRMALQKAASGGGTKISLMVLEQNRAAINLYRKMGFQQSSIATEDSPLNEDLPKGDYQRIIMSSTLGSGEQSVGSKEGVREWSIGIGAIPDP
jgi:ribosomal protein S18 acetylase RimI-like enzyme